MVEPSASKPKKQHKHLSQTEAQVQGSKYTPDVSFFSQMSVDEIQPQPQQHKRPKSSQGYVSRPGKKRASPTREPAQKGRAKENRECIRLDPRSLGSFKAAWGVYQSRGKHGELQKEQHMKKNSLRDQLRPMARVPPSKAFPKELELINKLLNAERMKARTRDENEGILGGGKNALFSKNKGKALSKSVCVDVSHILT